MIMSTASFIFIAVNIFFPRPMTVVSECNYDRHTQGLTMTYCIISGCFDVRRSMDIDSAAFATLGTNRVSRLPTFSCPSATGEPPLCMTFGVVTALRQAISSARADAGVTGWFEVRKCYRFRRIKGESDLLVSCWIGAVFGD